MRIDVNLPIRRQGVVNKAPRCGPSDGGTAGGAEGRDTVALEPPRERLIGVSTA